MKEKILEIAEKLRLDLITEFEAKNLYLDLFEARGRFYTDKDIREIKYTSFCDGLLEKDN